MRYCGRDFSEAELQALKAVMTEQPHWGRSDLSRWFCTTFGWRKPDGGVKDLSCRVALLRMEKEGLIALPPRKNPPPPTRLTISLTHQTDRRPVITTQAGRINLTCELVTKATSRLWNEYIERYHYLGSVKLAGAQLRYFIHGDGQVVALLSFSAAAWMTASRDDYIGWSHEQRKQHLHLVVNNSRFLLLPWVEVKNLCSRILSLVCRRLAVDWEARYAYRPVLVETFVQKDRFAGTCYKAANWHYCGDTTGRGKLDRTMRPTSPIKSVWVYPLTRGFRQWLCSGSRPR